MITNNKTALCFVFLSIALIFLEPGLCSAITPAGASIESHAELSFEFGIVTSETVVTTVEQMYGITIEPAALFGADTAGSTHYFPHSITNLGNGTDYIRFHFIASTAETWTYSLIKDDNGNGTHEVWETTPESNPLPLGEEGQVCFFVAVKIPTNEALGASREVILVATGEGHDGSYYIGANGTIYGGPDTAEASDTLTVEGFVNPVIHRDDATGKIYITWNYGTADIIYIQGTFDATFAGSSVETYSASSPFYCSTEAKDGKTRYYKIQLTGKSSPEEQIMGKFDVPVRVGLNELSSPLVLYANDPASLVGRQVAGASSANNADRIWKYNPSAQGGYDIAWLVDGVSPAYNGKWYTGSYPTTIKIGTDEGYVLEIRTGHPAAYITMVGEVSMTNRTIPVAVGMNFVGSCFPVEITLEASNLWQSGMKGATSANNADRLWKYNPLAQGSYDIAWLIDGINPAYNGKWYTGSYPTKIKIIPGYGYRLEIRSTHSPFTWTYKKPY